VPIEENTSVLKIFGFIGKPDTAKKMRGEQFIFVNNRFIKSHYLHHAIVTAYDEMIASDAHPLYILFLEIDPARIDVNVHPTKHEIKFEDEKIVYTFVHTAVKHSLGKYSVAPTLDFDQETAFSRMNTHIAASSPAATHTKQAIESEALPAGSKSSSSDYWRSLYEEVKQNRQAVYTIPSKWEHEDRVLFKQEEGQDTPPVAFQIHNRYILSQIKSGYIIADQQAVHERVLYEQYIKYLSGQKINTQQQLFPVQITLSNTDALLLNELLDDLKLLGFDIHPFGGTTYVIHSAPPEVLSGQECFVLEEILDHYKQSGQELKHSKREQLARSVAKLNSIKRGKTLSEKECRHLLDELFACDNPYYTPEGKPTFITYSLKDLEQQFNGKQ
jgi:DNA mismatch repair protein MutL